MIFGGNLCSQLAFALSSTPPCAPTATSLPLADLIIINSLASLLGGMAPVPGGMGVIEAGLIGGMTAAGVPQSEAVAATFTARLFTTYLPPIWGWAALQWLRRRDSCSGADRRSLGRGRARPGRRSRCPAPLGGPARRRARSGGRCR